MSAKAGGVAPRVGKKRPSLLRRALSSPATAVTWMTPAARLARLQALYDELAAAAAEEPDDSGVDAAKEPPTCPDTPK